MTSAQIELLLAVRDENVTWRSNAGGRISYRLWASDGESYTIVTPKMKNLPSTLVQRQMAAGYSYVSRGYCELTQEGKAVLRGYQDGARPVTSKSTK